MLQNATVQKSDDDFLNVYPMKLQVKMKHNYSRQYAKQLVRAQMMVLRHERMIRMEYIDCDDIANHTTLISVLRFEVSHINFLRNIESWVGVCETDETLAEDGEAMLYQAKEVFTALSTFTYDMVAIIALYSYGPYIPSVQDRSHVVIVNALRTI